MALTKFCLMLKIYNHKITLKSIQFNPHSYQDPNYWTSEHMIEVDRLLFLVPANPNGESVTPIRHHWAYALTYLTGHYFATHQAINKVAAVVFPFSVDVPHQVSNDFDVMFYHFVTDVMSLNFMILS